MIIGVGRSEDLMVLFGVMNEVNVPIFNAPGKYLTLDQRWSTREILRKLWVKFLQAETLFRYGTRNRWILVVLNLKLAVLISDMAVRGWICNVSTQRPSQFRIQDKCYKKWRSESVPWESSMQVFIYWVIWSGSDLGFLGPLAGPEHDWTIYKINIEYDDFIIMIVSGI